MSLKRKQKELTECDASVTADEDIETFSPKSLATLRYYAARMTSRLHQAPVDILWLMLMRTVKFAIIVTGSASYRMILTVFGDAEGTIVELMGFATSLVRATSTLFFEPCFL